MVNGYVNMQIHKIRDQSEKCKMKSINLNGGKSIIRFNKLKTACSI